ncbi:hypothetical protein BP6252_00777 [Coleophoma cylindrospora]|uniref:Uncharacterized protein n=1 Tax=Coleophoma cylindrospora TaxID=1849047 RepID=A0A3D8SR11_9HELO|nr:hypothetical protein BP6252_00777 [Coleophoma cylindrospora]
MGRHHRSSALSGSSPHLLVKILSKSAARRWHNLQTRSQSLRVYVSPSQIALALTIVRSKPHGEPLRDWIASLRSSAVKCKSKPETESRVYIDRLEFLKVKTRRLEKEKEKLAQENEELREQGLIRGSEQLLKDLAARFATRQSSPKDVRHKGSPNNLQSFMDEIFRGEAEEVSLIEFGEGRARPPTTGFQGLFCRCLELKQQRDGLVRLTQIPDRSHAVDDLTQRTLKLADQIMHVLNHTASSFALERHGEDERLAVILPMSFQQMLRCFFSCFEAMNAICDTIVGRQKKGTLICKFMHLFQSVLDQGRTLSLEQAQHDLPIYVHSERPKKHPRVKKDSSSRSDYVIRGYLRDFITTILYKVSWNVDLGTHRELYEGILTLILKHMSDVLTKLMFEEIVASSIPPSPAEVAQRATHLESRFLVPILCAALGEGDPQRKDLCLTMLAKTHATPNLNKARRSIQATLTKFITGADRLGDTLKSPGQLKGTIPDVEVPEMEEFKPQWVMNAVVSLVGFDMVMPGVDDIVSMVR